MTGHYTTRHLVDIINVAENEAGGIRMMITTKRISRIYNVAGSTEK
jgi:hypothetical protein